MNIEPSAVRLCLTGVVLSLLLGAPTGSHALGLENAGVITPSGMESRLLNPGGFWYDNLRGYLVAANTQARQIAVLNHEGQAVKVLGRRGELGFPVAVTGSRDGTLYLAERGSESLKVLPRYDTVVTEEYRQLDLVPYRRSTSVQTVALATDQEGNLYIADRGNRQIIVLDSAESLKFTIEDVGEPADLWVDGDGDIFVADPGFGGIRVYGKSGNFLRTVGAGVSARMREPIRAKGVAVDRSGRIWVVEETGQRIKALDSAGRLLVSHPSGLLFPSDLAVDDADNLYALEQDGSRIAVFRIRGF